MAAHQTLVPSATDAAARSALAARYYNDQTIFDAEMDAVFARSWVMVGHESQVASHGQVLTASVGDESVFVVNNGGRLGAFYNVCQHRGHELFGHPQPGGETLTVPGVIACPYHAWVYALDGALASARSRDVGEICLPPVRLERLGGFVCPNVHRSFTTGVVDPASYRIICEGKVIRHFARGAAPERSGYTRLDDGADYVAYFVWPASAIQVYPGQVVNTFRWVPLGVDRTLLVREFWLDTAEPSEVQREVIDLDWQRTATEDFGLVESVQRGLRSRGYSPGPLTCEPSGVGAVHSEDSVAHLGALVRSALGDER